MNQTSLGFRKAVASDLAGSVKLSVAPHGERTRPVKTESFGVLRLMQPLYLDDSGQVAYIIMNPGGALFGEKYQLTVEVHPDASLLLSSQSATRIHKTPGDPAEQEIVCSIGAGARLEYIPDQTIAYRDADFRQHMKITIAPDAQGFFAEDITPGWSPDGTHFTYANVHQRIDVRSSEHERLVFADNLRIQPEQIGDALFGLGYLEGYTHMASILILGQHTQGDYPNLVHAVLDDGGPIRAGITNGTRLGISWVMVRALANSTDVMHNMILSVNELDRSVTTGQTRLGLRRY